MARSHELTARSTRAALKVLGLLLFAPFGTGQLQYVIAWTSQPRKGRADNSPAIYRWVNVPTAQQPSPGRDERNVGRNDFPFCGPSVVPAGTPGFGSRVYPALKVLGYYLPSLPGLEVLGRVFTQH